MRSNLKGIYTFDGKDIRVNGKLLKRPTASDEKGMNRLLKMLDSELNVNGELIAGLVQ